MSAGFFGFTQIFLKNGTHPTKKINHETDKIWHPCGGGDTHTRSFFGQATPFIGTVTNFSKLNISLVITTNIYTSNGNKEITTAKSVKLTNKQFLDLFAAWAGTTWPSGAQLVQGWDEEWDGDVLVVDKTGTNVLYDAMTETVQLFFFRFVL